MQIAVVTPDNPDWPKQEWLARALRRRGHRCQRIAGTEALARADEQSDLIIFCQKGSGVCVNDALAMAPTRRAVWVTWYYDLMVVDPDLPLGSQRHLRVKTVSGVPEDTPMLRLMRAMDVMFVKERGLLREYRDLGVNAVWLDQGYPSELPACEHREKPEWDVLLFGSSSHAWRQRHADVAALLDEGVSVAWAGRPGDGVPRGCLAINYTPPQELPKLASRAAMTLGVDYRHDLDGYWSDRLWLALGMGTCHLRRHTPGLPDDLPCVAYGDEAELCRSARVLLTRGRDARQQMGTEARRWVFAGHTIEHRCEELLKVCERLTRGHAATAAAPAA